MGGKGDDDEQAGPQREQMMQAPARDEMNLVCMRVWERDLESTIAPGQRAGSRWYECMLMIAPKACKPDMDMREMVSRCYLTFIVLQELLREGSDGGRGSSGDSAEYCREHPS